MNRFIKIAVAAGLASATLAISADSSFAYGRRSYCMAYARDASRHVVVNMWPQVWPLEPVPVA